MFFFCHCFQPLIILLCSHLKILTMILISIPAIFYNSLLPTVLSKLMIRCGNVILQRHMFIVWQGLIQAIFDISLPITHYFLKLKLPENLLASTLTLGLFSASMYTFSLCMSPNLVFSIWHIQRFKETKLILKKNIFNFRKRQNFIFCFQPFVPGVHLTIHILKQNCNFQLQVCLSI